MKGIKIVLIVFMSVTLLCVVNTGFAQKAGKKEPIPQPQQPIQKVDKLVTIIRDCYISYIGTEKLYAVVETSVVPSEGKTEETGKNRGIERGKSTAGSQEQTVRKTYEYAVSPDVEIREFSEKGILISIGNIAGVGFITKADVFIKENEVIKIIILDMEQ